MLISLIHDFSLSLYFAGMKKSELAAVYFFTSTTDTFKEPLVTANTILLIPGNYPAEKVSCYISDDGCVQILWETAEFARKWVSFCKKYSIEPWAPEFYFSQKVDYLKSEIQASFLKKHRGKKVSDTFKFSLWTISIQEI